MHTHRSKCIYKDGYRKIIESVLYANFYINQKCLKTYDIIWIIQAFAIQVNLQLDTISLVESDA